MFKNKLIIFLTKKEKERKSVKADNMLLLYKFKNKQFGGYEYIEIDTINKEIRGYIPVHRIYQGWGESAGFSGYFVITYDKDITGFGTFKGDSVFYDNTTISNKENIGAFIRFKTEQRENVRNFITEFMGSLS